MSTFELQREYAYANSVGQAHKEESDMIENATWWNAIESRVGYFYDYFHDLKSKDKLKLRGLHPENDPEKVPIDIKYFRHTSQTYSKDVVTQHLRFRPGQKCTVPYYKEMYGDVYDAIFPVGCFVDIADNNGQYNKWLVVGLGNFYDMQFPSYEILPCDKVFQWIHEGKKYQMCGVLRSQNSYNSGIWTDYRFSSVEDQQKFCTPINTVSEQLFYNKRLIIDTLGLTFGQPRTWKISKINRIAANGTVLVTLAQDQFDEHKDYIEYDEKGYSVGYYADFYTEGIIPEDSEPSPIITKYVELSYKGTQNFQLKVGGSARTFLVQYYDEYKNPIDYESGNWSATIGGKDASKEISITPVKDGEVKVKVIGDDSLIGKECVITFKSVTGPKDSINMSISGL